MLAILNLHYSTSPTPVSVDPALLHFNMFVRSTFAITGLAALSSAFLVPSTIVPADLNSALALSLTGSDGGHVQLDCPGCPVALKRTQNVGLTATLWGAGPAFRSTLDLDIKVKHMQESDVIMVNNVQLFPITQPFTNGPLIAQQNQIDDQGKDLAGEDVALGYNAAIKLVKAADEKEPLSLYKMRFSIVEVGDMFIEGLDVIELDVIATSAGGLMITDTKKVPTTPLPMSSVTDGQCRTMICKLKEAVATHANRLQEMRPKHRGGCHGKSGMRHSLKGHPAHANEEHFKGRHHHRHHRFSRFLHNLKNVALQVLIPISIGIATGMTASLLGMAIGHLVVAMWRFFIRGNARGECSYANAHREPVEVGSIDEKKHFILVEEDEIPLPPYRDDDDEKSESV